MSQLIHLAIASTTSKPGHVAANLQQIIGFARRAADDGAHLLLTPEMSATGYGNHPEILAAAEVAGQGPIYQSLAEASQETGVVICAGFVERNTQFEIDRKHLSHYAVFPDGNFVVQRKHRVTHSELPLEPLSPQHPSYGDDGTGTPSKVELQTFEVSGVRCAIVICADTGIQNLNEILDAQGVRVLLAPTGAGGKREDRVTTEDLKTPQGREKYFSILETVFMPGRACIECIENRRVLAAVNLCGYDGYRHYHVGHGSITNPMGEVVGFFHGLPNLDRQRPMYVHAEIDVDEFVDEFVGEIR